MYCTLQMKQLTASALDWAIEFMISNQQHINLYSEGCMPPDLCQLSLWSAINNTLTCTVRVACHLIYVCIYHGYIEECCSDSINQAASDIIFVQNVNFIVCLHAVYTTTDAANGYIRRVFKY